MIFVNFFNKGPKQRQYLIEMHTSNKEWQSSIQKMSDNSKEQKTNFPDFLET